MQEPLVTVYIPTYNRVNLLDRAVTSVLSQTYKNLEIIIVDDCSTDGTKEYLASISDSRVKYFIKNINNGACVSRNIAIANARGQFITGLDDDDFFLETRISDFVKGYNSNSAKILSSRILVKDNYTTTIRRAPSLVSYKDIKTNNLIGNQIFTRVEYMRELGGFDESLSSWQDYDMWLRLLRKYGDCLIFNEPTYVMDISHDKPRITTSSKAHKGYLQFLEKHMDIYDNHERKILALRDKVNRGEKISLKYLFKNFNAAVFIEFIKSNIRYFFPKFFIFIKKKL